MKFKIILYILATILASNVWASSNPDANEAYMGCSPTITYDQKICDAFLSGFLEGMAIESAYNFKINFPISVYTIKKVFMQYMEKNPGAGDERFGLIMSDALIKAGKLTKK